MYEVHAETNEEYNEPCHYCTQLFKTKRDVMLHSKKSHKEKVKPCRNFLKGQCDYTEIDCWFSHTQTDDSVKNKFECTFCGENFDFHSESKIHKKKQHKENFQICREETNNCHFWEKCWFLHMPSGNEIEYQNGKNQDYLENYWIW